VFLFRVSEVFETEVILKWAEILSISFPHSNPHASRLSHVLGSLTPVFVVLCVAPLICRIRVISTRIDRLFTGLWASSNKVSVPTLGPNIVDSALGGFHPGMEDHLSRRGLTRY
jgi:hypothetical protein